MLRLILLKDSFLQRIKHFSVSLKQPLNLLFQRLATSSLNAKSFIPQQSCLVKLTPGHRHMRIHRLLIGMTRGQCYKTFFDVITLLLA